MRDSDAHLPVMRAHSETTLVLRWYGVWCELLPTQDKAECCVISVVLHARGIHFPQDDGIS